MLKPVHRARQALFVVLVIAGQLFWARPAGAAAALANLVVPASAVAGQDITVSFDTGPSCAYIAIAFSPFPAFVCPSTNGYPYPWVLHDTVHYANGLSPAPDFRGVYAGGLYVGCGTQTLSYVLRVPPDAPSTIYAHVLADDSAFVAWGNNPCSYDALLNSAPISVSGSDTTLRVDLLSQRSSGGAPSNVYQLIPSIQNWGHWPVDAARFCVKMSVYEPASPAIVALGGSHYILATNDGVNWGPGIATPFSGSVSGGGASTDCAADRRSNWTLQSCYSVASHFIPGNGGYLKPGNDGDTAGQFWNGGSAFNKSDDYSQSAGLGVGFAGRTEDYHYRLYDSGALVCERIAWDTPDPATGQEPCGISACVTPTPTPTRTPTPSMPLVKTVSASQATLGDTLTYCLDWSNDSSAPQPLVIWDTLHAVLTYVGASVAPSISGKTLSWDLGTVAPGSQGQICFWARVDGYP